MLLRRVTQLLIVAGVTVTSVVAQESLYPNEFNLGDVKLLDGPFKTAMDLNTTFLLKYTVDRLLSSYLKDAGLTPKAADYTTGGAWVGLNGHIGGHYLSAMAMQYAASGNAQCKERMDYMVTELKRCQDTNGKDADFVGYVSGIPNAKAMWRSFKTGNFSSYANAWVPWYNIHKTYAGLRDAWMYGGNETAKTMFLKLCDWGMYICAGLSDTQVQTMLSSGFKEQGGINEMYADAYQITNDTKYLNFAKKFSHKWLLDDMAKGADNLSNVHANATVPKIIGFARIGETGKDNYYAKAADFFWTTVTENRSVAIGGNSRNEWFPSNNRELITDRCGMESCNTNNMLKLTEDLYRMKQDVKYVDFYERALFNHILSTQNPTTGGYVYFTPAHPQHYRVYCAPDRDMWCCVGTGMENHTKYGEFIYTHQSESLYVNLFIASELDWKERGMQVKQETNFPDEEKTTLSISTTTQQQCKIFIRHPSWVPEGKMKITINGDPASSDSKPSTYVQLARTWNGSEKIEVTLPMHFNIEKIKNVSDWVAITRGPIVLGAKVPTNDINNFIAGDGRNDHSPGGTLRDVNAAPKLTIFGATFQDQFKPVTGKNFTYKAPNIFQNKADTNLVFEPFAHIHNSRYMMYWNATVNGAIVAANEHPITRKELTTPAIKQLQGGMELTFANTDPSRYVTIYSLLGKRIIDIPAFSKNLSVNYTKSGLSLKNGTYAIQIRTKEKSSSKPIYIVK